MKIYIRADSVTIEGYVNAVERNSKPLNERGVTFIERIAAGTFKRAIERARDIRILLNHKKSKDLGGISDGNLELEEDNIGLKARAVITDPEAIREARRGNFVGWSFGFYPIESRDTSEDGMPIKELSEIDLREVSLLNKSHTPAYDGTLVAVRDNEEKMIIGESMIADEMEIREEAPENEAQDDQPEPTKEVTSEYFAGYKSMIAEMKA